MASRFFFPERPFSYTLDVCDLTLSFISPVFRYECNAVIILQVLSYQIRWCFFLLVNLAAWDKIILLLTFNRVEWGFGSERAAVK